MGQQSHDEPEDIYGLVAAALTDRCTMNEELLSLDANDWHQTVDEAFVLDV